ncbi:uncharacterized protein EV420DRAFT_1484630 [Desarmillaria tabescens]|uniref:Uncharacterized protein n=1 Tax=Armillaria tabescens TaxID=1929756 RepID=A0AA39JMC1_ARMTA|nr:uncharacterized protein EV420DRAFT_1484630 [Desarmillaria tabescens]KAK0444510.1 hypothetical protein EV420DRAFT_1484630 [Desarmillaria tabescens]
MESISESLETESEESLAIQEHYTDFSLDCHIADMGYAASELSEDSRLGDVPSDEAKTVMERWLKLGKDILKRLVERQVERPGIEKTTVRGKYFKTCPLGSEPSEHTQCLHHAQEKNMKQHGTRLMDWLRTKTTHQDSPLQPSTSSSSKIIIIDIADSDSSCSIPPDESITSSSTSAQMWSLPDSVDAILMDVDDEISDMPAGALEMKVEDDETLAWRGRGFKPTKIANQVLRGCLKLMLQFLQLYTLQEYIGWTAASDLVASHYGKHNSFILEDEDLANKIHLHLQGLGKYIKAQDIINYLAQPSVQA